MVRPQTQGPPQSRFVLSLPSPTHRTTQTQGGDTVSLLLQQTQALALAQHYVYQQQQRQQSPETPSSLSTTPPLSPFGSGGGSGGKHTHSGGKGDRGRGINASNLKTELCRNYPNCMWWLLWDA